jgi:hypothetical protein
VSTLCASGRSVQELQAVRGSCCAQQPVVQQRPQALACCGCVAFACAEVYSCGLSAAALTACSCYNVAGSHEVARPWLLSKQHCMATCMTARGVVQLPLPTTLELNNTADSRLYRLYYIAGINTGPKNCDVRSNLQASHSMIEFVFGWPAEPALVPGAMAQLRVLGPVSAADPLCARASEFGACKKS